MKVVVKDDQVLAGYTDKNKLVNFKAPKEMIGKLVEVRIDEVTVFIKWQFCKGSRAGNGDSINV